MKKEVKEEVISLEPKVYPQLKEMEMKNKINIELTTILLFLIGLVLIIKGSIGVESIFNLCFVFGTIWLLYTINQMEVSDLKKEIKEIKGGEK